MRCSVLGFNVARLKTACVLCFRVVVSVFFFFLSFSVVCVWGGGKVRGTTHEFFFRR